MGNVIDFLERLGSDAHLRAIAGENLERALAETSIDPVVKAAMLGQDRQQLETLIGAQANVCCMVRPGEEDDEEEEEEDDDDDDDDDEEEVRLSVANASVYAAGNG